MAERPITYKQLIFMFFGFSGGIISVISFVFVLVINVHSSQPHQGAVQMNLYKHQISMLRSADEDNREWNENLTKEMINQGGTIRQMQSDIRKISDKLGVK